MTVALITARDLGRHACSGLPLQAVITLVTRRSGRGPGRLIRLRHLYYMQYSAQAGVLLFSLPALLVV